MKRNEGDTWDFTYNQNFGDRPSLYFIIYIMSFKLVNVKLFCVVLKCLRLFLSFYTTDCVEYFVVDNFEIIEISV